MIHFNISIAEAGDILPNNSYHNDRVKNRSIYIHNLKCRNANTSIWRMNSQEVRDLADRLLQIADRFDSLPLTHSIYVVERK